MRKITVSYDGAEFVIAPLTVKQYRELIVRGAPKTNATDSDESKIAAFDAYAFRIICASLNRADGSDLTDNPSWTPDACESELDRWLMRQLLDDILRVSGLKAETATAGEQTATLNK